MACNYRFSFVPGFFADYVEVAKGCPNSQVTTQPGLGLLERTYDTAPFSSDDLPQWKRFTDYVENLNKHSPIGESYKLIYLVRHGLSVHNIFMDKVGHDAWKVSKIFWLSA